MHLTSGSITDLWQAYSIFNSIFVRHELHFSFHVKFQNNYKNITVVGLSNKSCHKIFAISEDLPGWKVIIITVDSSKEILVF